MLKPVNSEGIIRSIEAVLKNKDIERLTKDAYNFVMLMSGFIAHYDRNGFVAYYDDIRNFVEDLRSSLPIEKSMAERDINETPARGYDKPYNGYGYEYCRSVLETVQGIEKAVNQYADNILKDNSLEERRLSVLREVVRRCEETPSVRKELLSEVFS